MSDTPNCYCKACALTRLNPEPTDWQVASFKRHHEHGTSPGNPKWYHVPTGKAPFVFEPGRKPMYPAWTYSRNVGTVRQCRDDTVFQNLSAEMPIAEYVKAFEALCYLGTPEQPKPKRKRASRRTA